MGKFAFDPPKTDHVGRHVVGFSNDRVEGSALVRPNKSGKSLHVVYMGASPKRSNSGDDIPNTLGPRHVREVVDHIKKTFPKAENLYADRTSGARYAHMTDDEYDEAGGQAGTRSGIKIKK